MYSYALRQISCLLLVSLFISNGYAQVRVQSINELLDYLEEVSPEVQRAKAEFEVTKQKLVQAAQIPNPEVAIGNWSGRAASQSWKQTDITITQPVELGGKRSGRKQVAEAEIKEAEVALSVTVAELRLKTLFSLYRLRQLSEEILLLKEAKETFSHLVSNYKKRPQLSPEQATTLFNFEMARNDYELKIDEATSEYSMLAAELKISTSLSYENITKILPMRLANWPKLENKLEIKAPSLKVLAAQTELSESELKLAKADIWPTVNIGPSYTMQNQFGEKANILGLAVSFPIPVWNQNNGAKAVASTNMIKSKKMYQIEKSALEIRRDALVKTYLSSSKILETQGDNEKLHKKHGEVETNFLRGLISSSLVIESHRQIFENQKLYNDRELKTLNVYYQIVLLEGRKVEGI